MSVFSAGYGPAPPPFTASPARGATILTSPAGLGRCCRCKAETLRSRSRETAETASLPRHNPELGRPPCRHHVRRSVRLKRLHGFRLPSRLWRHPVAEALWGSLALGLGVVASPTERWAQWGAAYCHGRKLVVLLEPVKRLVNTVQRCLSGGKPKGAARRSWRPGLTGGRHSGKIPARRRGRPQALPRNTPLLPLHVAPTTSSQTGRK